MKKHYNIFVSGDVQGVFFRVSAQAEAVLLGLNGFAQNTDDGKVYIEIEGEDKNLDEFVKWCKTGSPEAKVKKVDVEENEIKNYNSFDIR